MTDEAEPSRRSGKAGAAGRAARFVYDARSSAEDRPPAPHGDYLADANLYRRSSVRTIEESEGQPLDSTTSWFLGNTAAFYKLSSNSCVEVKRTSEDIVADGLKGVAFIHASAGRYTETAEGAFLGLDAGDLGMVHSTVALTTRSRRARISVLYLPRPRIVESLDSDLLLPGFMLRNLSSAPLAPFVGAQMKLLFDLYGKISAQDFESALDCTAEMILHLMRGELVRARKPEEQRSGQLRAALDYIDENAGDRDLDVEHIGRALGMSRSKLYKLFAERNLTVAGYLADIRLRRFVDALRTAEEARISQLAWICGFDMQPADFARLFKREYGMTPREARMALQEGRQVLPLSPLIGERSAKP